MTKKLDIKIRKTKDLEAGTVWFRPDCRDLGHDGANEIQGQGCTSHAGLWKRIGAAWGRLFGWADSRLELGTVPSITARMEDSRSRHFSFAFDREIGYCIYISVIT